MASNREEFVSEIYVNDQQAKDAMAELAAEVTKTAKAYEKLLNAKDADPQKTEKARKAWESARKSLENAKKGTEAYATALKNLSGKSMQNLLRMQRQIRSELNKTKPNTEEWKQLAKAYQDVTNRIQSLDSASRGISADSSKVSSSISGITGKLGGLVTMLSAIGLGITSITEAVKQSIQASQTLADKWNNGMSSMKMTTQAFFAAATSGDWSAFNAGLEGALKKARELAELEDLLGSFRIAGEYVQKEDMASMTQARTKATDTESSPEERMAALEEMKQAIEDYSEFVTAKGEETYKDLIAYFNQMKGITFASEEEFKHFFDRLFRYSTTGRDKDAENAKAYFDMLVERYTTVADETGAVMNVVQASSEALTQTIQKYGLETAQVAQAIEINDEGHTKLVKTYGEYADAIREVATMQRTYQRTRDQVNKQLMSDELKELENSLKEEQNLLKQQYVNNLIDKASYETKMSELELKGIQERIIILTKYGSDYQGELTKILDLQIKAKESQLKTQMKSEVSAYDSAIKRLQKQEAGQKLIWKRQYAAGLIDKRTYETQIAVIEEDFLNLKMETAKKYGKDTDQFMEQLLDRQISRLEKAKEMLKDEMEEMARYYEQLDDYDSNRFGNKGTSSEGDTESRDAFFAQKANEIRMSITDEGLRDEYELKMKWAEKMAKDGLITEEEAEKYKLKMKGEYAAKIADVVGKYASMASDFVNQLKEAETQKLEAEYQAQLTAAGDNAEEREQIEADYEKKKLDLEKKYADVDMAISIAKTIANGAAAAIRAYFEGGPYAGPILAALIAATTAAEVATIIAQRNAIKNASVNSSGSSASTNTGKRTLTGYAEGGNTPWAASDKTPVGIVHANEYVIPAWMKRREPVLIANLERYRKAGSRGRSGSMAKGFVDGGSTTPTSSASLPTMDVNNIDWEAMREFNAVMRYCAENGLFVKYGDILLAKQKHDTFKNQTKR